MGKDDRAASTRDLTPREQEILALLQQGFSDEQIARRIGMAPAGAQHQLANVLAKVGTSREELASPDSARLLRGRSGFRSRLPAPLRAVADSWVGRIGAAVLLALGGAALALVLLAGSDEEVAPGTGLGKLAYLVDGDIWVKALPGGEPVQVTEGGYYWFPKWSSTGEWLLVGVAGSQQGREVMRTDGTQQRMANSCVWSPTEDVLACSSGTRLRIETPEGNIVANFNLPSLFAVASQAPYPPGGFNAYCSLWSHDGKYLTCGVSAVLEGPVHGSGSGGDRYNAIWVVAADGTNAWEVLSYDSAAERRNLASLAWSNDGSAILLGSYAIGNPLNDESPSDDGVEVSIVPATGGEGVALKELVIPRRGMLGERSPGGTFTFTIGEGRQTWTNKRIAVFDPPSGQLEYLTDPEEAALQAAWSPENDRLAYVAGPDIGHLEGVDGISPSVPLSGAALEAQQGLAQRNIWTMHADGSNNLQLTDDNRYRDEWPQWSKDGSSILFARIDANSQPSIWLMGVDSGVADMMTEFTPCGVNGTPTCFPANGADEVAGPFWFGYYGHIHWTVYYDWWQPLNGTQIHEGR